MAKGKKSGRKKAAKAAAEADLFAAVAQAARSTRGALARRLLASGLYAGQDAVIALLDAEGGQTPSAIAAALGVRAPTITKTLNRLAAQGFVVKSASKSDARMTLVQLSEAGYAAAVTVREALAQCQETASAGMSRKDVKTLVKLLRRVDANLKDSGDAEPLPEDSEAD